MAPRGKNIVQVPNYLTPMQFGRYPADNAVTFERWYYNNWNKSDERDRLYLPIQWTALYCNNGYGNHTIKHSIQKFIDELDRFKKYYTIVQYDDGILNNIDHLDIKVCAMSGPRIDFALPLLCTPHKFNYDQKEIKKIYKASFVGNLTHAIRAQIINELSGKEGYYISTQKHGLYEYCKIIAQSKYVLCPRGYGQSSFRIQEAIDFGAIPIYISDEHIYPYGNVNLTQDITFEEIQSATIDEIIKNEIEPKYNDLAAYYKSSEVKHLFTYEGCKKEILNYLKNEPADNQENNGMQ